MTTKDFPKLESLNKANELGRSYNIDKITDKIYLGCEEGAKEYDFLKTEKINNIISIIPEIPKFPDEIKMKSLNFTSENCLATGFFKCLKECIEFIENSDKVFIHGTLCRYIDKNLSNDIWHEYLFKVGHYKIEKKEEKK